MNVFDKPQAHSASRFTPFLVEGESRLRLQTIVRLRWFAVMGQLATIAFVTLVLGFQMPLGYCLGIVALSAWLNVFLAIKYPARHRLSTPFATLLLAYDILQLAALLYLTGGIENPFVFLVVAPVTVSAATLPARNTVMLGLIASAVSALLAFHYMPLPWYTGMRMQMPLLYKLGILIATYAGMLFLALYAYRLSRESQQMSAALAATELVLAREQKLHALDGLAAAAAHELGTPLATIVLVSKELNGDREFKSKHGEDLELLRSQAERCREILKKLTRRPSEQDPMHSSLSIRELIEEAVAPHRSFGIIVSVTSGVAPGSPDDALKEPVGERRPGTIFGVGNLVENAVDYAKTRVDVRAEWSATSVTVVIADDGPGFPADVLDTLGEPFVTRRAPVTLKRSGETSGLGLGFFIAKTLLERSGATIALDNRRPPEQGAVVRITWPRPVFENRKPRTAPADVSAPT